MVPIIFAISLGLFLIGLVIAMLTVILRDGTTGHWCRHCNGPIADHLAENCPICGKSLQRHFVIHKRSPKPFPIWAQLLLWTCFVPLPAAIASEILMRIIDVREVVATQFLPQSGAYESVTLESMLSRQDGKPKVRLTLVTKKGASHKIDVRPEDKTYDTFGSDGKVTKHDSSLTDAKLTQWMGAQGVDVKTKGVSTEIDFLVKQIDVDLDGQTKLPGWSGQTKQYKVKGKIRKWAPLLLALGWFTIWLLGCIRLIRGPTRHCPVDPEAQDA